MNFRQTAVLLGAILLVGVALLIVTYTAEDNAPETGLLTEELAGVKPEQIDALEIEREGAGKLKIVRTDAEKKAWEIVEPYRAPADAGAVEATISALVRARPVAHPELSGSLAAHGLEPPGLRVTIRQGTDKASTVNLGNVSIGGSKGVVFVTTSARPNRPMAVPRNELDALFKESKPGKAADVAKWVGDYRSHSVFPADSRALGEDVTYLKLDLPNKKKELALSRTPSGGWKFDVPPGWGEADAEGDPAASLNTFSGVNPLLRTLTTMSAASAADFIDNPGDLKQYGLNPDNPDLVRVEMRTKDGKTTVAYLGKTEAGPAPPPSVPGMPPPGSGGKAYVRVEGQPGVIRASAGNLSGLVPVITDPSPLRDRALVTLEARKQVDGLDILLPGQPADRPTKVRRVGGDWKLYGGPGDPQNAYTAPIERIVEVVTARRAIKDFPPPNPANFASVSATLFVWVDGFNPPSAAAAEPVKKGEPTKLEFGRKEGDAVYVRRTRPGNVVNEFTVPAMLKVGNDAVDVLATVAKTRLDLLDPSLPPFSPDAVQRLTVSGQNNYALEKDQKPDPSTKETLWRFAAPEPKGRVADAQSVDELLRLLGTTQSVTRFVDEAPAPQKLAEYGLAPAPRLKAVVGLPNGEQRAYEFGKDTPDPAFVYARAGGKPAVFTLPRLIFDRLAAPDLRDRMIFRNVPTEKVNEVELTGWGGITLKFQKNKDGVWAAQPPTPPTFNVDPGKVNAFLSLLARTRVKGFEKGPPEAKHGFGDPKQNVQAVLRWPGGAISLNLGASPDNGQTYYGSSAWLPQSDPVFTVDAAPFKPYKEGPGGFAK